MEFSKHCGLCEHEMKSLEVGLTCKLTQRKPDFKNTCPYISLDERFQEKLESAHIELEKIRRTRNSVHFNFYFLIAIGFLLIIGSTSLAKWTHREDFFWVEKIGAIGLGISILTMAYSKLNSFRGKLKKVQHTKNDIDEVIDKYGIGYESYVDFEERIHGTQQVNVTLEFKNWKKKRTTTTYEI